MTKSTQNSIRYEHAGDLKTDEVLDLIWAVGSDNERFQEIAIVGDKVIGSWSYTLCTKGSRNWIDSSHTDVAPRFRKRGIAATLWRRGVQRWNPTRIAATIGSDEGRCLLARMHAEFSYSHPSLHMDIKPGTDADSWDRWHEAMRYAATSMLRRLHDRDVHAKKPAPQLTAVAGGKS
jgi:hypothetical protein